MNLYVLYTPKIFAKIIESLMGIKLTLKTLKYEMLLLFDDGVVISIALRLCCYEKHIVFVKTIGKCNWILLMLVFVCLCMLRTKLFVAFISPQIHLTKIIRNLMTVYVTVKCLPNSQWPENCIWCSKLIWWFVHWWNKGNNVLSEWVRLAAVNWT